MIYLFIAGHGLRKDGSFDPGATGYIKEGEHRFYKDKIFPLMGKYANGEIIFHTEYNVYDRKNIIGLAQSYGMDTEVVEWHYDAWKESASGGHVIVHSSKTPDRIDMAIRDTIQKHIGLANRWHKGHKGIDGRSDFYNPNICARYGVNYRMVELGFGTNKRDSQIMINKAEDIARDMVLAITRNLANLSTQIDKTKTPIANQKASVSIGQMKTWAGKKGADQIFIDLADSFYNIAIDKRLDPALLYGQSALETAFMNFTGVLDGTFKNPCGMKTGQGGDDSNPHAHHRFSSWEEGIIAQADHLNLYGGAMGYPKSTSPDPRHFSWIYGTAKHVEDLSGKWASDKDYGDKIVRLMEDLQNTQGKVSHSKPGEKKKFDYAIAYANEKDRPSAEFLENQLKNMGHTVFSIHTEDMRGYDNGTIIQIGGHKVKASDIEISGANEEETARQVMEFIKDLE